MKNNCTGMESKLADLLLDPASAPAKVRAHVAECDGCRSELAELKATMASAGHLGGSGAEPLFSDPAGCADAGRAGGGAGRLVAAASRGCAPALPMDPGPCAPAGGDGADHHAAGGRRSLSGLDQLESAFRLQARPPWCTICKRWTTTPRCWTRWKLSPARITETKFCSRWGDAHLRPDRGKRPVNWISNAGRKRPVAVEAANVALCVHALPAHAPRNVKRTDSQAMRPGRATRQGEEIQGPVRRSKRSLGYPPARAIPWQPAGQTAGIWRSAACARIWLSARILWGLSGNDQGPYRGAYPGTYPGIHSGAQGQQPGYGGAPGQRPAYPGANRPGNFHPGEEPRDISMTGSTSTEISPCRARNNCCATIPALTACLPPISSD